MTEVYGYTDDTQATASGAAIPYSERWTLLTGFTTGGGDGDEIKRTKTVDIYDNETITHTYVNRGTSDAKRLVTRVVGYPDSTTQKTITRNGLMQEMISKSDLTTEFGYDAVGRRTSVEDSRGNTTTTSYDDDHSDGWVESVGTNPATALAAATTPPAASWSP